jgi:hypothetical protein
MPSLLLIKVIETPLLANRMQFITTLVALGFVIPIELILETVVLNWVECLLTSDWVNFVLFHNWSISNSTPSFLKKSTALVLVGVFKTTGNSGFASQMYGVGSGANTSLTIEGGGIDTALFW